MLPSELGSMHSLEQKLKIERLKIQNKIQKVIEEIVCKCVHCRTTKKINFSHKVLAHIVFGKQLTVEMDGNIVNQIRYCNSLKLLKF